MDNAKDISLNITLRVPGKTLLEDTDLKIAYGRKYGLIGNNGLGKSTLLRAINDREFDIPKNIDIFYVDQEEKSSDKSIFDAVLECNRKRLKLINKLNEIQNNLDKEIGEIDKLLEEYDEISNKLNQINAYKDESIIKKILCGLGFDKDNHTKPVSYFSGGWRMRVSLAKALYMQPNLLLLDEPSNHLDLNSVIWLTDYLSEWKKTLIIVSHDKNFLNEICTDIIHLTNKKLFYYDGNYEKYILGNKMQYQTIEKEWRKIELRVKEMQRKNTSKEIVKKFIEDNKSKKPIKPYKVKLDFGDIPHINNCLVDIKEMEFSYGDRILYHIDLEIKMGDRITIVGKNGVGKSTLFKLIMGDLKPTKGYINIDSRARIGYYYQHASDYLPLDKNLVEYLQTINGEINEHDIRKVLGSVGLEGGLHHNKIETLSGGQKSRLVFASLFILRPHLILLDEPTNHLDIETIDALIKSINNYEGAVVLITHNIELIEQTKSILYEIYDQEFIETTFEEYEEKVINEINL